MKKVSLGCIMTHSKLLISFFCASVILINQNVFADAVDGREGYYDAASGIFIEHPYGIKSDDYEANFDGDANANANANANENENENAYAEAEDSQNWDCQPCATPCERYWPYTLVGVRHLAGRGIGFNTGYTSLDLFVAADSCTFVPFVDLRGHVFNDGKWAANAGVGGRLLLDSVAIGANVFYDYRQGHSENNGSDHIHRRRDYNQIGAGLELIGCSWDAHVNGYFPVGKKTGLRERHVYDHFIGNFYAICEKFERALPGVDGEVGMYLLRRRNCCNPCDFDLYAALGGYYFKEHCRNDIGGVQARVAMYLGNYVTAEVMVSNDNVFNTRVAGQVGIHVPFGGCNRSCCDSGLRALALQPVQRQEIIVLSNTYNWEANFGFDDCDRCSHRSRSHSSSRHSSSHHSSGGSFSSHSDSNFIITPTNNNNNFIPTDTGDSGDNSHSNSSHSDSSFSDDSSFSSSDSTSS
jgi:hypothetical protein